MSKPRNRQKPAGQKRNTQVGMWEALRDVGIHSIHKGQFPVFMVNLVAIVAILKMPSEDVSAFATKIMNAGVFGRPVFFGLTIILSLGWLWHSQFQRRKFAHELRRVTEERNKLQAKLLKRNLKSSDNA